MATEIDVTFKEKDERYLIAYFNTSKSIEAANVRFPKQLELIDDNFGVTFSKKSILPMTLWCKENNLTYLN